VGQQTLAVFLTSLVAGQILGIALDVLGRGFWSSLLVNAAGILSLIATALVVTWFKGQPWRRNHSPAPAAGAAPAEDSASIAGAGAIPRAR
jgi:hypothetical protein